MTTLNNITTILFDLDGTLMNTSEDLLIAVNQTLAKHEMPQVELPELIGLISHGSPAIISKTFGVEYDSPQYHALREDFLAFYVAGMFQATKPFPEILELLDSIEKQNFLWGIVTNKYASLAAPLLKKWNLLDRSACLVGADQVKNIKPHPEPLLLACKQIQRLPHECLYFGDAEKDIQAGKSAGMLTAVALYGFIPDGVDPYQWQADLYFKKPSELEAILTAV